MAAGLAICLAGLPALAVPPGWTTPRLVLAERFGPRHAMVVDSAGKVHMAVEGLTSRGIWYVSNAGGEGWFSFKVTAGEDHDPSIAIDASDRVTIAFDRRDPDTMVSRGIWTVSNATGTFLVAKRFAGRAYDPSVQLAGGRIHLAFQGPGHSLLYRTNASGSWVTTTIAASGCCSGGPSLVVDGTGRHIAWSRHTLAGSGKLRLSSRSGGAWSTQTVDANPTRHPSLAMGSGIPFIAYVRDGAGTFMASPAQAGWGHMPLGSSYGQRPDIAVTGGGIIHVVQGNGARLRWVVIDFDSTAFTTLVSTGDDFDPEIGLFGGKPRVVYNHAEGGTGDGIRFIRQT